MSGAGSVYSAVSSAPMRARAVRASGGARSSTRAPRPASRAATASGEGPSISTGVQPSGAGSPCRIRAPKRPSRSGSVPGAARPRTVAATMRSSMRAASARQAVGRSKLSGRTAGAPVSVAEVTRPTRKVRRPRSVPATR
ncbi:hypothetical protein BN2537_8179 [Streptomyces venezuelae]|nr:hypothetical protein BN2537_8179 [Streptomyces venezuelae]